MASSLMLARQRRHSTWYLARCQTKFEMRVLHQRGRRVLRTMSTIQGNSGVSGAKVSYSGAASGSVTADANGLFTISGLANGTYSLTPSLTGFTFTPTSASKTINGADILNVNFTASNGSSAKSVKDCRIPPNGSLDVNGTQLYVVPASTAHLRPVDSRAAGAPVDCRVSAVPQNSRA